MFLFPAAEEQGILGSQFFAESGVLAPGKIAANINLELGNVWGRTEDVVVFGKGKNTLEDHLVELARMQGRVVRADDDPRAGWYYRSDQFRLARVGVPAIWFRSGTRFRGRPEGWGKERFQEWISTHYHQPTDEVSPDWNYDGLVEDAHLAFWLGFVVANQQEMPSWYAGDEFEEIREASLKGP
jgi:Zn-dependent M28 family amino/carboxypeptidase